MADAIAKPLPAKKPALPSYCDAAPGHPFHGPYHDREYGFPLRGDADRARLLADPGIIRNRLKVNAAIENARRILALRESHGGFAAWIDAHHPLSLDEWRRVFKRTFVFTGGEIVNELLVSTGWLAGAHKPSCPVYRRTVEAGAPWVKAAASRSARSSA